MDKQFKKIQKDFTDALKKVTDPASLEELEVKYFSRKGVVSNVMRDLKNVSEKERARFGKLANQLKEELTGAFEEAKEQFGQVVKELQDFDETLPGKNAGFGHLHPNTQIQRQLEDIFRQMGFLVLDGPELESEYYNFTALNIPDDHPARDTQDTFWMKDGHLLRTHTSPVQVRALQKHGVPFKGVVPGRVFRYESTDASHEHTFYQMEGLMVDKNITVANLIAVMKVLLASIFQREVEVRLRPGYFPFVEPGFELDLRCLICDGKGCSVCKQSGWVELIPCGMVHPNVLKEGGVDPSQYTGFAFGLGLTRLVMMKYGIDDIRLLMSGDIRFLEQF